MNNEDRRKMKKQATEALTDGKTPPTKEEKLAAVETTSLGTCFIRKNGGDSFTLSSSRVCGNNVEGKNLTAAEATKYVSEKFGNRSEKLKKLKAGDELKLG